MKLQKNTGAKSIVLAVTAGLFVGLFSLIRANPQVTVDTAPEPPADATPDYDQVFRAGFSADDGIESQDASPDAASTRVHTRTRGS